MPRARALVMLGVGVRAVMHRAVAPDLTRHPARSTKACRRLVGRAASSAIRSARASRSYHLPRGSTTYREESGRSGRSRRSRARRSAFLRHLRPPLLISVAIDDDTACLRRLDSVDAQRLQSQFGRMDSASGRHGDHHLHRGARPGGCANSRTGRRCGSRSRWGRTRRAGVVLAYRPEAAAPVCVSPGNQADSVQPCGRRCRRRR
jgi:hypothetical protein